MKAARLVVLGVAVAAGGIAAYLAAGKKAPSPPPPVAAAPALETVEVLVAKSDLSRGQVIQGQDIGWQAWPKAAANSSFIKKSAQPDAVDKFAGSIVRVAMLAGDPIRGPYVVMAKGSGFMAAILPKGMRAVAVDISAVTSAGGFILPDDRVDVVLTRRDKSSASGGDN
ncbi:MAG TPA: Flp pilus assembly protein CpaB, partial [Xanthobacteraceae bacterium]|nr:Flp pilus assembly protein CpaB [Xanthobacteraceae bacterium]